MSKKLDKANPIHGSTPGFGNEDFRHQISGKIDDANSLKEELSGVSDKLEGHLFTLNENIRPLSMIGKTEVRQDPEIQKIYNKIKSVEEQVTDLDKIVAPNNTKI